MRWIGGLLGASGGGRGDEGAACYAAAVAGAWVLPANRPVAGDRVGGKRCGGGVRLLRGAWHVAGLLLGGAGLIFFPMKNRTDKTNGTEGLPRLMTVSEAARWLRVSRRTVERSLWAGEMEHYRIGSRIVIPEESARIFLESRKIGGLICG